MTLISYYCCYDTRTLECRGHTGFGTAGRDILCSAVSCLCHTLDAYLQKARDKGYVRSYSSELSPGYAKLCFELCDEGERKGVNEAVDAILTGFLMLEESFPDFISTDI